MSKVHRFHAQLKLLSRMRVYITKFPIQCCLIGNGMDRNDTTIEMAITSIPPDDASSYRHQPNTTFI